MQLKKYFQTIHTQTQNKYLRTYIILVALRVCLVFVPQLGYIHPDEFFQSVEIVAGNIMTLFLWLYVFLDYSSLWCIPFFFFSIFICRRRVQFGSYANMGVQQYISNTQHHSAVHRLSNPIEFLSLLIGLCETFFRYWFAFDVRIARISTGHHVCGVICQRLEFVSDMCVIRFTLRCSIVGIGQFICDACVWLTNFFQ